MACFFTSVVNSLRMEIHTTKAVSGAAADLALRVGNGVLDGE
jgi:hypothetical protein